jgi:hypothetical protein
VAATPFDFERPTTESIGILRAFGGDKDRSSSVDQEGTQVAIPALGDGTQTPDVAAGKLLRD